MNVLIIGAGTAGQNHAGILAARDHDIYLYDASRGKAEQSAQKIGCSVAATPDIPADLSVVAVPTAYHYDAICRQLDNGRTVVSEKPLCLRPEEAQELAGAENLYIAESQGYGGTQKQMKRRIDAGEFGNPVIWRINAMSPYRSQPWSYQLEVGGGAFLEGGVHMLTVARALFGDAVGWQGAFRRFAGGTGPDTGQMIVEYERGDMVFLSIGWGTSGCWSRECEPMANQAGIIGPDRCEAWWDGDNHEAMWDALLPAIEAGEEPFVTVEHAAGAVKDVWKCYEAGGISL